MKITLTKQDCEDVMNKDVMIGADISSKEGVLKMITFNAWMQDFSLFNNNELIERGHCLDYILKKYNEL
jgi:hypothetical protein